MGQKVNPTGIRLGIVKDHNSVWYADKDGYSERLIADIRVREYLEKKLANASVSKIVIERPAQTAKVTIHTARPGVVIGKKGEDVDRLRGEISSMMSTGSLCLTTEYNVKVRLSHPQVHQGYRPGRLCLQTLSYTFQAHQPALDFTSTSG